MAKVTPLMQQYHRIKKDFDDTLVFFQVGDFYELFFDDAQKAAAFLGITLTKRGKEKGEPIPLCGVPVHALEHYLTKLIKGGFKVAIADQLSQPKPGTIVERGITRVLTPGTLTESALLDEKSASYLCSFFPLADRWGILFGELLTGQLFATELMHDISRTLESELVRFFPDEVIVPKDISAEYLTLFRRLGNPITTLEENTTLVSNGSLRRWMHKQFGGQVRREVESCEAIYRSLGLFYAYMTRYQQQALDQFKTLSIYTPDDFLFMDSATQRNLELVRNNQDGSTKYTLFSSIDNACTGMGSRMIKKWLLRPLRNINAIEQRQQIVTLFVGNTMLMHVSKQILKQIGDIERIIGRIALRRATRNDYKGLLSALLVLPNLHECVNEHIRTSELLALIASYLHGFNALTRLLVQAINTDTQQPWVIAKGFDKELDRMREYAEQGNSKLLAYEKQEQESSGIASLKVRYNKIQGYYIEITKPNLHLVPDHYIRHQSLVGKERFITTQLQALHHEINQAIEQVENKEKELFEKVTSEVYGYITPLRKLAYAIAHLDALWGLAHTAYTAEYSCPEFNDTRDIIIEQGRHPVVEGHVTGAFIPNNTHLTDAESLWIITGPNMGGKSTYLRQVALISVLAHVGSFVPARRACIALLDRIFTRIGAGDNLAEGKSTFLVEMEETALICTHATAKSLIILDEVGRGTSTYDGLAIAQAVIEHLYTHVQARCLFATHYHELYHLSDGYPGIVQYHAASKKSGNGIIFLHTIIPGVADESFGIEVAKLAHLPESVVRRAQQLVRQSCTSE